MNLGLLRTVGATRRPGRPIARYRATALSYLIPADRLPAESFERASADRTAALHNALYSAYPPITHDADVRVSFSATGEITLDRILGHSPRQLLERRSPAVIYTWMSVALSKEDAKNMQRELLDVLARYRVRQKPHSEPNHLVHIGMAPLT